MNPKVLVGCPTHKVKKYALDQYAEALKKLTYDNFDILLVDNSDDDEYMKEIKKNKIPVIKGPNKGNVIEKITNSRNMIRDKVLKEKYDYFLSLEQDVLPPENVIETLMSRSVPVVSGLYGNVFRNNFGKFELKPIAYAKTTPEEFELLKTDKKYEGTRIRKMIESGEVKGPEDIHSQLSAADVAKDKITDVLYTGLGCMLIKREVLEKIPFRAPTDSFDDYAFCMDVQKKGYKVWLDTSVRCGHVIERKNAS